MPLRYPGRRPGRRPASSCYLAASELDSAW